MLQPRLKHEFYTQNIAFAQKFLYNARAMHTDWSQIPEFIEQPLRQLVYEYGEGFNKVHYIILFGSFARNEANYHSDADIMIVHSLAETRALNLWRQVKAFGEKNMPKRTDAYAKMTIPVGVDVVTEKLERFEYKVRVAAPFYMDVMRDGILLYSDGTEVPDPQPLSKEERARLANARFKTSYDRGIEFFAGIDFYLERGSRAVAAFHTHQALENAYKAMMMVYDAYVEKTHDPERLLKRAYKRDPSVVPLKYQDFLKMEARKLAMAYATGGLPEGLSQTQEDWIHICNSYVPPRYEENYEERPIEQLDRMKAIVAELMLEIERSCKQKIKEIENGLF